VTKRPAILTRPVAIFRTLPSLLRIVALNFRVKAPVEEIVRGRKLWRVDATTGLPLQVYWTSACGILFDVSTRKLT